MSEEEKAAQVAKEAEEAEAARVAAEASKSGLDADAANAELKKVRAEAAKTRIEKKAAEKREAELAARVKTFEDADKSDTERAQAAADELKASLAETRQELSTMRLTNKVLAHGVRGADADYAASKYAAESDTEGFVEAAFFVELRKAQPYLFGETPATPAPASGAPGAPASSGAGGKKAEIETKMQALIKERDELRMSNRPGKARLEHELGGKLYKLKTELRAL